MEPGSDGQVERLRGEYVVSTCRSMEKKTITNGDAATSLNVEVRDRNASSDGRVVFAEVLDVEAVMSVERGSACRK
jgi:hypothetical protein